jgi:hypothetical protein
MKGYRPGIEAIELYEQKFMLKGGNSLLSKA